MSHSITAPYERKAWAVSYMYIRGTAIALDHLFVRLYIYLPAA